MVVRSALATATATVGERVRAAQRTAAEQEEEGTA